MPFGVGEDGMVDEPEVRWYAIQTRPRHEKRVDQDLQSLGLSTYLPLIKQVRQWSDRRQAVEVPIFPRYLFIHSVYSPHMHQAVISRWGVCSFVGIRGQALPIPDQEIANIEILLRSGVPTEPFPFLNIGDRVRCRDGALDGLEGILVNKNKDYSLVVSFELLRRSLCVRLFDYEVESVQENHLAPTTPPITNCSFHSPQTDSLRRDGLPSMRPQGGVALGWQALSEKEVSAQ